jgi:hypothetical protein
MIACGCCGTQTKNKKYCSKSCSATVNNLKPKRARKQWFCVDCSVEVTHRRQYCDDCDPRCRGDITLAEAIYKKHHRSSAFALVRTRARVVVKNEPTVCEVCSYDKHIEVAHVKGVAEFSEDTLLSVINDRSNLRLLCPNCHWELDNL